MAYLVEHFKMNAYILDSDKQPVAIDDPEEWAKWMFLTNDRIIATNKISRKITVSTVFLGIDHNFLQEGQPILFETMIFGGWMDGYQDRHTSYDLALIGHMEALEQATKANRIHNRIYYFIKYLFSAEFDKNFKKLFNPL
jgi:hypothetical protein